MIAIDIITLVVVIIYFVVFTIWAWFSDSRQKLKEYCHWVMWYLGIILFSVSSAHLLTQLKI